MQLNNCDDMIEPRKVRSILTRTDGSIVLEIEMGYWPGRAAPSEISRRRPRFAALADVARAIFILFLAASLAMAIELGIFDAPPSSTCTPSIHTISLNPLRRYSARESE